MKTELRRLTPGPGNGRWLLSVAIGVGLLSACIAEVIIILSGARIQPDDSIHFLLSPLAVILPVVIVAIAGIFLTGIGLYKLNYIFRSSARPLPDYPAVNGQMLVPAECPGPKVVAIGGGTGLPGVLRGLKHVTSELTAIVTVADNGGSSGRLRRDMGILPPGDLRNNIAALANDEDLMTQLFQYRFSAGDLDGHSFGNLFLTALSDITGSMEHALLETERVLAIRGSVMPATLDDVTLKGEIWQPEDDTLHTITGESEISRAGGRIERVSLKPPHARAYPRSVQAILAADLIVLGPGSLFTSLLPSLLIRGIAEAIRASSALRIYICNVATQPGETEDFDVADHVVALEKHVGPDIFQIVVANNHFPDDRTGTTHFVPPAPDTHDITRRYQIIYADLTDSQYPWRHNPGKLARILQACYANYQASRAEARTPHEQT